MKGPAKKAFHTEHTGISPTIEPPLCHAVGGASTHIHIAATVAPAIEISKFIGDLKGASAHYLNHVVANEKQLGWQSGYGVVSFGGKDLPWVAGYIENQKEHHRKGATHDRLERVEAIEPETAGG